MGHASTAAVPRGASEATMMKQPWLEAVIQHAWAQQLWYTQAVVRTFLWKNSHIVHLHLPTVLLHRGRLRIALQFSQVVRHRDCVCRDQGHQCSVPQGWAMKILWAQLWWGWFGLYFGHRFGVTSPCFETVCERGRRWPLNIHFSVVQFFSGGMKHTILRPPNLTPLISYVMFFPWGFARNSR